MSRQVERTQPAAVPNGAHRPPARRRRQDAALAATGINPVAYTVAPETGCWHWQRSVRSGDYPQARYQGRLVSPARHIYERLVGPIPPGQVLQQTCANVRCVNPAHQEPVPSEVRNRARAKLSVAQVRELKRLAAARTMPELAAVFGVSNETIRRALRGETWSELGPSVHARRLVRSPIRERWRGKLPDERPTSISERDWAAFVQYVAGASGQEVAAAFGLSWPNLRMRLARTSKRLGEAMMDGCACPVRTASSSASGSEQP